MVALAGGAGAADSGAAAVVEQHAAEVGEPRVEDAVGGLRVFETLAAAAAAPAAVLDLPIARRLLHSAQLEHEQEPAAGRAAVQGPAIPPGGGHVRAAAHGAPLAAAWSPQLPRQPSERDPARHPAPAHAQGPVHVLQPGHGRGQELAQPQNHRRAQRARQMPRRPGAGGDLRLRLASRLLGPDPLHAAPVRRLPGPSERRVRQQRALHPHGDAIRGRVDLPAIPRATVALGRGAGADLHPEAVERAYVRARRQPDAGGRDQGCPQRGLRAHLEAGAEHDAVARGLRHARTAAAAAPRPAPRHSLQGLRRGQLRLLQRPRHGRLRHAPWRLGLVRRRVLPCRGRVRVPLRAPPRHRPLSTSPSL
ncbi:hypothetical protein Mapa_005406 [Marchantia paleacea]|nr:hypothetical protein Mapa_005406 [Marchantia paleacea]